MYIDIGWLVKKKFAILHLIGTEKLLAVVVVDCYSIPHVGLPMTQKHQTTLTLLVPAHGHRCG